jgi:hypothetical protein
MFTAHEEYLNPRSDSGSSGIAVTPHDDTIDSDGVAHGQVFVVSDISSPLPHILRAAAVTVIVERSKTFGGALQEICTCVHRTPGLAAITEAGGDLASKAAALCAVHALAIQRSADSGNGNVSLCAEDLIHALVTVQVTGANTASEVAAAVLERAAAALYEDIASSPRDLAAAHSFVEKYVRAPDGPQTLFAALGLAPDSTIESLVKGTAVGAASIAMLELSDTEVRETRLAHTTETILDASAAMGHLSSLEAEPIVEAWHESATALLNLHECPGNLIERLETMIPADLPTAGFVPTSATQQVVVKECEVLQITLRRVRDDLSTLLGRCSSISSLFVQ